MDKASNKSSSRLLSLDALRGFDMIWILGAEGLFMGLFLVTGWSLFETLSQQFLHSVWHGFTFYDLIFPLFIFLSGVTIGLSNKSLINRNVSERVVTYRKALKRLLILFFLGIVYNHGWGQGIPADFDSIRYASVLLRIGLSWFICALIVWHFRLKTQVIISIIILFTYWIIQQFIPTPNGVSGSFTIDDSWNAWIDQTLLPGITYKNAATDPEGLFSQVPAVVNALAGAFAGKLLGYQGLPQIRKAALIFVAAVACLIVGWLWSFSLPINKTLWTSSFALVSIGYSGILLAVFYVIFDVWKFSRIGLFFAVIGANSILLYVLTSLFNWQYVTNSLFKNILLSFNENFQGLAAVILLVMIQWLLAKLLYKHRIFIRV
jgi:predicted acyltransferase